MTTLVTGATGLLGNNVARLLLDRGQSVRVFVRAGASDKPYQGLDVEIAYGDVRNAEEVRKACHGVQAIIHAAAQLTIGWSGLDQAHAVNVIGTRNVGEAAREAGIPMVHVSTVDAFAPGSPDQPADEESTGPKPLCTYVVTKRQAEVQIQELVTQGLNAVIVNPGFMLGPWDWKPSSGRMLVEVATRFMPLAPTGGMSLTDVRDVAAGVLAALERGQRGRRYILAGHNMTYLEAWRLFAEVAGSRPPWGLVPRPLARLAGRAADLWGQLRRQEPVINSAAIQLSELFHYYSSARAESELGYRVRPARESVENAWRWFVDHGYV